MEKAKTIDDKIAKYQIKAIEAGLEVNVIRMYQAFYQQHKTQHGSYKPLIKEGGYDEMMQQRYDWIFKQIEWTLEAKQIYQRGMENV